MASIGNLQFNIRELSELEKKLRMAFIRAQKTYTPPVLNPVAAFRCAWHLRSKGLLRWREFYPLAAAFVTLFSFLAPLTSSLWCLALYVLSLGWAFYAVYRYANQFAIEKTGDTKFVRYGFGVTDLSLLVLGMMEESRAADACFKKDQLAAIIKLVKASQEHGDVSHGFFDTLKKAIYGVLFSAPMFLATNAATASSAARQFGEKFSDGFVRNPVLLCLLTAFGSFLLYLTYDIVFVQTERKRRNKRYLLILNIIHEGWK